MKRHSPQPLPLLATERIFIRLVCMIFVAALVSCTLPAQAEVSGSSETSATSDSVETNPSEKPGVPSTETAGSEEALRPEAEGTAPAGQELTVERVLAPERVLTPFLTFAAIEKAWNAGRADSIIVLFPEEKISLRLEANVPEEAFFSRKQAAYMLKDALGYTVTESFEFLEFRYDKDEDVPPFGNAQWSFRREPAGEIIIEKVHVTLRKEGNRWLISEIRILD